MTRATEQIKEAIRNSPLPIKSIATKAGVSYDGLRRWFRGRQHSITLDMAERVWFVLTGRTLM